MTEANDSWVQLPCGSVVVRELPTQDWMVSWYPNEGDPNYPGFTILLSEKGVQAGNPRFVYEGGAKSMPRAGDHARSPFLPAEPSVSWALSGWARPAGYATRVRTSTSRTGRCS
jgi:hypothetical protein